MTNNTFRVYPKSVMAFNRLMQTIPHILFRKFSNNSVGQKVRVDSIDNVAKELDLNEQELNSLIKLIKTRPQHL